MLEVKVTILTPDLSAAINRLSDTMMNRLVDALMNRPAELTCGETDSCPIEIPAAPAEQVAPAKVPVAPMTAPAVPVEQVAPAQVVPPVAPVAAPETIPAAPVPAPAPAPAVPEKAYNLNELSVAASSLIEQGKMQELMEIIRSYGVISLNVLPAEHYADFAAKIRKLGAKI